MSPPTKQQSRWRPYAACEECGVEPRAACRTEDDLVAEEPCPGRRLTPAGIAATVFAPAAKPASRVAVPVDDTTRVEVAAVVALDGMRARDRVILAAIDDGVGAWEDLGAVGVADVVAAIAAQRRGQAALADSLQRIRDVVAAQPDGLRAAIAQIECVRSIVAATSRATPETVPNDTISPPSTTTTTTRAP